MTNIKRPKWRSSATTRDGHTRMLDVARELELRAIEEQFLAEQRAGLNPRLSTYLRRYPDHGAELAAFMALTLVPDSQVGGALLVADDSAAVSHEQQGTLSAGTQRALDEIFGSDAGKTIRDEARVAEGHATYSHEGPPTTPVRGTDDHGQ